MGLLDQDFELPSAAEPGPTPVQTEAVAGAPAAAAEPTGPMVVVHYRRSGWPGKTLPAILLLAAGAVGVYYRLKTPDWRGLSRGSAESTPKPVDPAPAEPPAAAPLVVRVDPPAPPPVVAPEVAPPTSEPVPTDKGEVAPEVIAALDEAFAAPEAVAPPPQPPPLPPVEVVAAAPPARADARAIEADIRREAEAKQAQQVDLAALKRRAPAVAQAELLSRAGAKLQEEFAKNDDDRRALLAEVQRAVKANKATAAAIRELCDDRDHSYSDNVRKMVEKKLDPHDPRGVPRGDHAQRVRVARQFGLPEVVILEALAKDLLKDHAARNGPTNADEALVRAARFLLTVPLPRMPRAAAAAVPPGGPGPVNR